MFTLLKKLFSKAKKPEGITVSEAMQKNRKFRRMVKARTGMKIPGASKPVHYKKTDTMIV